MKHSMIRVLSVVLVLALCLSLFAGLTFAASVNYQTGNPNEDFSNVILNWGKRGTTATFLSPNAEEFYSDNQVTYDNLVSLSGGSTVSSVPSSALYKTLQSLMQENHSVITSYADTRDLYSYTDCQESDRSKLTCFYSGVKIGPNWGDGTWNREHTWPNSKGMEGSDEDDIMMLRPTSSSVNSSRGNKCYGPETTTDFYNPNGESNGQYNLHGDVARIALYVYVRWGNTEKLFGADGVIQSLDVLLDWMEEDPVDTWEMGRNDSVESITGTRNVFVDYPELAFALFNEDIPAMETPSGEAMGSYIDYDIAATTNNAAWGTVSVSGQVINASPATGYRVAGYTVVSGDATVTAKGNAFTVKSTSDCVIQINFEPRVAVAVNYYENGINTATANVYSDDTVRLPGSSAAVAEGYTFMGWLTDTLAETTDKPAQIYAPDQAITVTEDMSFYALYSRVDEQGGGSSTAYALFTGKLEEGSYLVTYENGAMKASVTKNRMDYLDVTPVGTTIDNPDASIIWELAFTDDGYVTLYNKATSSYMAGTGASNKAKLQSSVTDYAKWTVSGSETYDFVNLGNGLKEGVNKTLRKNLTYGFACYATATGGPLTLYKQSSGTVYYSTSAVACQHNNTTDVTAQEPNCTEAGYTAGVFCEDCKTYLSGHEKQDALGHSYDAEVTPPTTTEGGYTTYTCTICGDTYIGDRTDALGEAFTVSFRVPAGVAPVEDLLCDKSGITLPTADAPEGYTFAGWVTEEVNNTDVMPTVYKGTYTTDADVTLYALYTYTVGGSADMGWHLVTDAASLSAGDRVVLAHNASGVVDSAVNKQFLTAAEAVFSEDGSQITQMPDAAVILVLGKNGDFWTLTNEAGQALGATAVKKIAFGSGNTDWTITIDENAEATVANADESRGRFLYNFEYTRFTTYTSDVNNKMFMPHLYKLEGSQGTTYYTTVLEGDEPEIQGVTVSGTVTSGKKTLTDVTVELWAEGADRAAYTTTAVDGAYTIENVAAGTYTVKVSKTNYVTRSYELTVGYEDATQDVQICLLGDANMDGTVNIMDVSRAYAHVKGNKIADAYALTCADINGKDGVNITDVSRIYAHIKGTKKLF